MTVENATFTFVVSWFLWLVGLSVFNTTRIGHVLLYYSLLLMILFVLVTEYKQLQPYIIGITNVGTLLKTPPTTTGTGVGTVTPTTTATQTG
jgi:hypothetical protein